MSNRKQQTKKNQLHSVFSVVGNFQSPLLLSNLSIPTELDRVIVRSLALFGDSDCLRDTLRRNPAFNSLDSTSKVAARNRRRYLLAVKEQQPEKFEEFCVHYSIPFHLKTKDLSSEFNNVLNHQPESNNISQHTTNKTMALVVQKPHSKPSGKSQRSDFFMLFCIVNLTFFFLFH